MSFPGVTSAALIFSKIPDSIGLKWTQVGLEKTVHVCSVNNGSIENGGMENAKEAQAPLRLSGCPELTDRQYCPAHQKLVTSQYNRHGRTQEMKKRYNGAWPSIRRRFIAAHPLCNPCHSRITAREGGRWGAVGGFPISK